MRQTTHEKNLKSRHISHAHVVSMVASNTPEGALSTRQLLPELLSGSFCLVTPGWNADEHPRAPFQQGAVRHARAGDV